MEEIPRVLYEETADDVDRKLEKIERLKEESVEGGKEEYVVSSDEDQVDDGKGKKFLDPRPLCTAAPPLYSRPFEMLQVFSLRLSSTQPHPINVYGTLTVRDFSERSRDYPATIIAQVVDDTTNKMIDDFLRFQRKHVEGRISDVESLRSVFLSVSKSLKRLGAIPQEALWKRKKYFIRLQGSLKMGIHSLSLMELTFRQLKTEIIEKAAAASAMELQIATRAYRSAVAIEARAVALLQCDAILETCRTAIACLQAVNRKIGVKLSGAQGVDAEEQALDMAIQDASTAMRMFAAYLRPAMQIINASEGMPPTIKHTFKSCRELIMPIKSSADRWFVIFGIGAFSFRKDLKKTWRKLMGGHEN